MVDSEAKRRPWRGRVAAVMAVLLLVVLLVAWLRREPIARSYVDAELARRGVPASYVVTGLAPRRQRIERLVLGDPKAPDLVADWAELEIAYGIGWPRVRAVRAGGVRLRARVVDGRVSFGSVDRLLPPPSGAPISLPDLVVSLADARVVLDSPAGRVGVALDGAGNLQDGFRGRIGAVAKRLAGEGCVAEAPTLFARVTIRDRRPTLDGPLRAARLACGDARVAAPRADMRLTLSESFDRWDGEAGFASGALGLGGNAAAGSTGRATFAGDAKGTAGALTLRLERPATDVAAAARGAFTGRYQFGAAGTRLDGGVTLERMAVRPAAVASAVSALQSAGGTPVAPLGAALARSIAAAARSSAVRAGLVVQQGSALAIEVRDGQVTSASGARATIDGRYIGGEIAGRAALAGGGFPEIRVALDPSTPGRPVSGTATVAPFAAGGARLALTPVRIAGGRFATTATLDGPLGDGRVEGLSLPLSGRIGRRGFAVNEACAPLAFRRLAIAGLDLGASRLALCPKGALVASDGRTLRGGGTIAGPRVAGRLGGSPVTIAAARIGFDVGRPGFDAEGVAVRLGGGDAVNRLDVARLAGTPDRSGMGGRFEGAAGKLAAVPLLVSDGAGTWRLAGGALALKGAVLVSDAEADPRFVPLAVPDFVLDLTGGTIRTGGTLIAPASGAKVSEVAIVHDLSQGAGHADLAVPGITFGEQLQPEALTRLTLGVVANVVGTVRGNGRIDWGPGGVTSSGDFRTDALDLAAAFGPVTGLTGTIHFSDLLALATPPGQEVRLGEVNPGVAVLDGVVRYQLLPDLKVAVEGGRWPFAGGTLTLEPSVLDFSNPVERRLTFRVDGLDAAKFIEQFEFDNVAATGTFDGVLPMIFDQAGGRIVDGRLVVRRGGGTLAYVGQISNEQLGTFGKLAFDALKSMKYDSLAIELDGSLDGELISRIVFAGINQNPPEKVSPMSTQLTGLPFKFNITVRAPFRALLNSAAALADPRGLINQSLPAPLPADGSVQPVESGVKP